MKGWGREFFLLLAPHGIPVFPCCQDHIWSQSQWLQATCKARHSPGSQSGLVLSEGSASCHLINVNSRGSGICDTQPLGPRGEPHRAFQVAQESGKDDVRNRDKGQ